MKVFISWSGELSRLVAELLSSWVQNTIQGIEVWISTDDIDKGSLWFRDISTELAETTVGIICLTQENLNSPWILFEAGALAKGLSKNRVCPLLINLSASDLIPPLSQFNATLPEKADMLKLIKTINAQRKEHILSEGLLEKAFSKWWGDFDTDFQDIIAGYKPQEETHQRPMPDIIEEILQITRAIQRNLPISTTVGKIELGDPHEERINKIWIDKFLLSKLRPSEPITVAHIVRDLVMPVPVDTQIVEQPSKEEKPKRKIKKTKSDTK